MIDIYEYIQTSKIKRQEHLKLDESCIERGGNSENARGLLAHVLDTTIPKSHKILLCHACNNGGCNNPNHLYWGTPSENIQDAFDCGNRKKKNIKYVRKKKILQVSEESQSIIENQKSGKYHKSIGRHRQCRTRM